MPFFRSPLVNFFTRGSEPMIGDPFHVGGTPLGGGVGGGKYKGGPAAIYG